MDEEDTIGRESWWMRKREGWWMRKEQQEGKASEGEGIAGREDWWMRKKQQEVGWSRNYETS